MTGQGNKGGGITATEDLDDHEAAVVPYACVVVKRNKGMSAAGRELVRRDFRKA